MFDKKSCMLIISTTDFQNEFVPRHEPKVPEFCYGNDALTNAMYKPILN